ncbi:MAG: SynChlorMet cassette protein ScmD [Candidatus Electronema sp. V4]|uniref:SynChlorMet cassette protein ScmD n=1 Tax=Candidatus Electronema sp. V4 TaxID=3454756 RepID=UPI004055796D
MSDSSRPVANPMVILREEFDDWALLFDPDTGKAFGLNPVSVFIWKRLDGNHLLSEILKDLRGSCDDIPANAGDYIQSFVNELIQEGLAGYEIKQEA